jgi:hypothetical protein
VRWTSACEDVSPGAEKHPLLEDVSRHRSDSFPKYILRQQKILRETSEKYLLTYLLTYLLMELSPS